MAEIKALEVVINMIAHLHAAARHGIACPPTTSKTTHIS